MCEKEKFVGENRFAQPFPSRTLPISAIVVGLNEAHYLRDCLSSVLFCDEIIYVDLGSTDDSIALASSFGAETRTNRHVRIVEEVHAELVASVAFDWILFIDPDERIDETLQADFYKYFSFSPPAPAVGVVSMPEVFYFKKKKLIGTPWGGVKNRKILAHRGRFQFTGRVHKGRVLRDGFEEYALPSSGIIHHYWSNSWISLYRKHRRYLELEGFSRYETGERISFGGALASFFPLLKKTFANHWQKKDGVQGSLLCLFWVWYKSSAQIALWRYQKSVRKTTPRFGRAPKSIAYSASRSEPRG